MNKDHITVYFAGAIRGDRTHAHIMNELISFIKNSGFNLATEHIGAEDPNKHLAESTKKEKKFLSVEEIESQDISWIDSATHFIAEVTGASTGTGREIEYARNKNYFGKTPAKILCIYLKEKEESVSAMVRGMKKEHYPNVDIMPYNSLDQAKDIVYNFLKNG